MIGSLRDKDKQIIACFAVLLLVFATSNLFLNLPKIKGFFTDPILSFKQESLPRIEIDTKHRINFLLFNLNSNKEVSKLLLATYDPEDKGIGFVALRSDIYTNIAYGNGVDLLNKSFLYGESGYGPSSVEDLLVTVSDTLAVHLDGYIYLKDFELNKDNLLSLKSKISGLENLWKVVALPNFLTTQSRTNLSLLNLAKVYSVVSSIRKDKITFRELGEDFYQKQEVDGNQRLTVYKESLDNFLSKILRDPLIDKEAAKIEIKNGTGKSGLATRASRLVNNLGLEVVSVDNAEVENVEKTLVINYSNKDFTAKKLGSVFDGEVINRPGEEGRRGDVVVVVGLNYYRSLYKE